MILQASKYLADFLGVSREIVYIEQTSIVKIYFEFVEHEDLCITFSKRYATAQEAYDEVQSFINRESSQMATQSIEPQGGLEAFIEAIQHDTLSLPAWDYELQGDMAYLCQQFL